MLLVKPVKVLHVWLSVKKEKLPSGEEELNADGLEKKDFSGKRLVPILKML